FKDEPIVGGYISGIYLIIIGYLFNFSKNFPLKYKNLIMIFVIFLFISIFITGERSTTIKAFLGLATFYFISDHYSIKQKIFSTLLFFVIIISIIASSDFLKMRYGKAQIIESNFVRESVYFNLYKSGLNVFKTYPILGVGNKNYRVEACERRNVDKNYNYLCNTHPHQLYIEFLSEHGVVGTIILLFIFFKLIFKNLRVILKTKNYVQMGCFVYLLTTFTPLIPSGAFFSDFPLTFFWLNLSLMYAVNKKTNIFSLN
ncbi:O-antigen ligase family protein, partial [Candidatus Pelagibacter sp.]|nr:O-antigen ligase family protein [Candidatus Pelagibacter sp.]